MSPTLVKTEHNPSQRKKLSSSSDPEKKSGFALAAYFQGVKQEWFKISWPTRQQVIAETGIVIVVVTFFTLFVFFADNIIHFIVRLITIAR